MTKYMYPHSHYLTDKHYITQDVNVRTIDHLVEWWNSGDLEDGDLEAYRDEVLRDAADALIEMHRRTSIDLKHAGQLLAFVQSVRPEFSIEGEPEW